MAETRLLGCGWPAELDDKMRLSMRARGLVRRCDELTNSAAEEGIVCIPSASTSARLLRYKPNTGWTKDRGEEPERRMSEYPWFWGWDGVTEDFMGGNAFDGNRWNACHYTSGCKCKGSQPWGNAV